jgi:hypothetical protein
LPAPGGATSTTFDRRAKESASSLSTESMGRGGWKDGTIVLSPTRFAGSTERNA